MNTMVDEQEQMKVKKKRMKKKSRGSLCVQFVLVLRENVFVSSFLVRLVLRLFSCVCLLFNLVGVCVCIVCECLRLREKKARVSFFPVCFSFPVFHIHLVFLGGMNNVKEKEISIF